MSARTLRVGSLFSGIGAFDLGMERAGFDVAWQVENDPKANLVLAKHWPDTPRYGDIRTVAPRLLAPVDVVVFGSPCQDLSVAGARAGLSEGTRSGLFFEAIRVIRGLRPTPAYAIWENVPGALSSHRGADFGAVLDALAECGALDIGWRVLDGRYAGVAQRRRRVWLVADFAGRRCGEILFEPESVRRHPPSRREAGQGAAADARRGPAGTGVDLRNSAIGDAAMTLQGGGMGEARGRSINSLPHVLAFGSNRTSGPQEVAGAINASPTASGRQDFETETFVVQPAIAFDWQKGGGGNDFSWRGKSREWVTRAGDYTGSLGGSKVDAVQTGMAVRRLTPVECLRLMSLPDDWLDGLDLADSQKYRLIGNSLIVNEAAWLGGRLLAQELGAAYG